MKKLILVFLLLATTFLYAQDFNQEGQVKFRVRSNHYYEFSITLRANTQYFFKLKGESIFNFRIIEPSRNEWNLRISDNNELRVWENIMEKGTYTIKVYFVADNCITMI